jgi:hypothetical protein
MASVGSEPIRDIQDGYRATYDLSSMSAAPGYFRALEVRRILNRHELEEAVSRSIRSSAILSAVFLAVFVGAACGPNEEAEKRAAQSGAEKYFEFVKAGKYDEAYRRTFTSDFRSKLSVDSFEKYRSDMAMSTGTLKAVTLVKVAPKKSGDALRLTFALEGEKLTQPAYEILDMRMDGDDWKVDSLDKASPGSLIN